jgi:hypothetical protein
MSEATDRQTLLDERSRLTKQGDALRIEQTRLAGSDDGEALRRQGELLRTHHEQLDTFHAALEVFHTRYGPLEPAHG